MLIKGALNGARGRHEHDALPLSPASLARDAVAVRAAGAAAVHVHARDRFGRETLEAEHCADTLDAIRSASPGLPVGLTTRLWIVREPELRLKQVEAWTRDPDFCSVNFSEAGRDELCQLLTDKGIGIEAGLSSVADARLFAASGFVDRCLRVLIEIDDPDTAEPIEAAAAIGNALAASGIHCPVVQHGFGPNAWPLLEDAIAHGYDVRIGLEDTLVMPDGSPAKDNAALVAAAAALVTARA